MSGHAFVGAWIVISRNHSELGRMRLAHQVVSDPTALVARFVKEEGLDAPRLLEQYADLFTHVDAERIRAAVRELTGEPAPPTPDVSLPPRRSVPYVEPPRRAHRLRR